MHQTTTTIVTVIQSTDVETDSAVKPDISSAAYAPRCFGCSAVVVGTLRGRGGAGGVTARVVTSGLSGLGPFMGFI
jgi:hypothetical protein